MVHFEDVTGLGMPPTLLTATADFPARAILAGRTIGKWVSDEGIRDHRDA
jgi:hypothetical protein